MLSGWDGTEGSGWSSLGSHEPCLNRGASGRAPLLYGGVSLPAAPGTPFRMRRERPGPPPGCAECPGRCPAQPWREPSGPPPGCAECPWEVSWVSAVGAPGTPSRVCRMPREVSWASAAGAPGTPSRVRRMRPGAVLGELPSRFPGAQHAFELGEQEAEPFRRAQLPQVLCLFAGPPSQSSPYTGEKVDPYHRQIVT